MANVVDHKEIEACKALLESIGANGLEHAVRLMSVGERGYARRRIKLALNEHIMNLQLGEASHGGADSTTDLKDGDDSRGRA